MQTLWELVAWVASRPRVANWLIERSKRTPYSDITSRDGSDVYMGRWWLFNPYGKGPHGEATPPRWEWLPSIRVHHIMRADDDVHLHDHPWNARTIVLRGGYVEERPFSSVGPNHGLRQFAGELWPRSIHKRHTGYTGPVKYESYHRISHVTPGGVFTLWFTWRYRGTWGFLVDGRKVPWREYLKDDNAL